jgi:chemotaxis protein methyltransferase CheR
VQRAMVAAAAEFGFPDSSRCAHWLLSTPLTRPQLNALATHLTIGETYFFRERKVFDALAGRILPELLYHRRGREQRLRLWSAACCTGEEPYSLAILVDQLLGDSRDWQVTILATDINERFLQRAAAGVYGEWSFRDSPADLKERYFTRSPEGRFVIDPEIKRRVKFMHMNLARDPVPPVKTDTFAMDVILCRNLLMYFTPPQAQQLVERFHSALTDGGWLAVAPSECSQTLFSRFVTVAFPDTLIYRKQHAEDVRQENSPLDILSDRAATPHPHEVATTLYGEGRHTEAADILLGWLSRSPPTPAPVTPPAAWHPGLLSLLTRALANQGRLTEALAWSEHWIAADKLDPAAHYLRAIVLQETGELEAARRCLGRAVYLQPDFALAHFALANLSRSDSRQAEAHKHFRNAAYALRACTPDETLPESDGLTARRLLEIITEAIGNDKHAP